MYFIYSLLMGLAALLLIPYWLVKGLRHRKYLSNLRERLGFSFPALAKLPANSAGAIWIHAVSVGEALSGVALARRLKEAYPDRPLVVSTTTMTGQALARERMPFADAIIYFPLDWGFCVRRALTAVRPSLVSTRNASRNESPTSDDHSGVPNFTVLSPMRWSRISHAPTMSASLAFGSCARIARQRASQPATAGEPPRHLAGSGDTRTSPPRSRPDPPA